MPVKYFNNLMLHSDRSPRSLSNLLIYSHTFRMVVTWLLIGGDVIGLVVSIYIAVQLRISQSLDWKNPILYALIALYLFGLYLSDTYKLNRVSGIRLCERAILRILLTITLITCGVYLTGLWSNDSIVGRGVLIISVVIFAVWAVISRTLVDRWLKTNQQISRFLILADRPKIIDFAQEHCRLYALTEFVSFAELDEASYRQQTSLNSSKNSLILSKANTLSKTWQQQHWSGILIDDSLSNLSPQMTQELMNLRLRGVYVYSLADFCEQFWQKIPPAYIQDDWFIVASGFNILSNSIQARLKRAFDIFAAAILLIVTLPIAIPVALAIKLTSKGSIFYSQVRTGLNGKSFWVYKFRSMYENAEAKGIQWTKKKDPRITLVGSFIRLTRIDELPQLWNVFRGEMSLIGPRPERPEFDSQLREAIPYYDVRYLVKPGITGWAQVCYPYGDSVEDAYQKVAYDLFYIKNYSLFLDLAIAIKTLRVVILGKGR